MEDIKKIREFFSKPLNELEKETKISISIPDNTSYVDFAKTVAKILIDDYGSRNFIPFMKILEEELNLDIPIMYSNIEEAQEKDPVDTITMDVPLFIRMLEYAREDAKEDMDLHDITEKANLLGKERGILQMEDYNEIIGTTENTPIQEMIKSVLNGKGIKRKK
jgi:hypothetical protein